MKKLDINGIISSDDDLWKIKKVGYVSIIGRPNTGKSTFINTLLWQKISITSNIPQTTRKRVLGIYNDIDSQIIFFDTPWIHKSEKLFNQEINKWALNTIKDADLILYFIDSSRVFWDEEWYIKEIMDSLNKPVLKVYSKIDIESDLDMSDGFKISSLNNLWLDGLIDEIKTHLKDWNILYPTNYYTHQDMYFRISEIVREKIFLNTREEVPHSIFVDVVEIQDRDDLLKIQAYIYTETSSQKYIIIWKWGSLLSKIWSEARADLEQIFEKRIFLSLRVKQMEKWRKNENLIKKLLK